MILADGTEHGHDRAEHANCGQPEREGAVDPVVLSGRHRDRDHEQRDADTDDGLHEVRAGRNRGQRNTRHGNRYPPPLGLERPGHTCPLR